MKRMFYGMDHNTNASAGCCAAAAFSCPACVGMTSILDTISVVSIFAILAKEWSRLAVSILALLPLVLLAHTGRAPKDLPDFV